MSAVTLHPTLTRHSSCGVTLLTDLARPYGVTLAFTERTGGFSSGDFASLNLGTACGDDSSCVKKNHHLALQALGAEQFEERLIQPRQVHGDHVVSITSSDETELLRVKEEAAQGADAVVCTTTWVPVLLCFADCVPVILAAPGGFAVIHSGWRGTIARISAKALAVLCEAVNCKPQDVMAYVGPAIAGTDYEVSSELLAQFIDEFGSGAQAGERKLDLAACISVTLKDAGLSHDALVQAGISTPQATDRFFSYRASGGHCGRHGALAVMSEQS